ncbi:hypothetical protein D5086_017477 [Populus alba]|uniref:Uncharacterized protein n=1 Tax=Populus alba TaxID=43335 RepID=A0ACC4BM67_POPAL
MRRFILPENANTDAISAVCQDGVLTVTVEKLPPKLTTEVEEEMLMRKFYDLMAAQGLSKKKEGSNNVSDGGRTGQSTASLPNTVDISDGGIDRHSSAIVPFTATDEQM